MSSTKRFLILFAIVNLIVSSIIAHNVIDPYILFISLSLIILVSEFIRLFKSSNMISYKFVEVISMLEKLAFMVTFFILVTSVCVFRVGFKPCDHCVVINGWWVLVGVTWILFLLLFMCFHFSEVFIERKFE